MLASIRDAVEDGRRAKQAETQSVQSLSDNKLSDSKDEHETKTAHKAAELFNTNRTYINEGAALDTVDADLASVTIPFVLVPCSRVTVLAATRHS